MSKSNLHTYSQVIITGWGVGHFEFVQLFSIWEEAMTEFENWCSDPSTVFGKGNFLPRRWRLDEKGRQYLAKENILALLYYSSIICKWWDMGGMTSIYIKMGGIHPTSNRPQPTTPRISLLLHVESKGYKKLTALIMHSCPCYESIWLIWSRVRKRSF